MGEVDDAKPVAFGIGQHDEVRIVGVAIPVDPDGAKRRQAVLFRLLFGCAGDAQLQTGSTQAGWVAEVPVPDAATQSAPRSQPVSQLQPTAG